MIGNINNRPTYVFVDFWGFSKASKCSLIFLQLKITYYTVEIFQDVPTLF